MTSHNSAVDALETVFAAIRRQAERDPAFGAELLSALKIPVEVRVEGGAGVQANMLFLDPVVIAGKGLDEFLLVFGRLKDPDKKKVIKAYNLASAEELTGRGAPKGQELVELMWKAASEKRARLQDRK